MKSKKTIIYKILTIAFIVMISFTGCKAGKAQSDIEGNKDENISANNSNENLDADADENQEADNSENQQTGENGEGTITGNTLRAKSPVYDPSLTKGEMAVYFISSVGVHEYCGTSLSYGDSTLIVAPDGTTMLIDLQNPALGPTIVATLDALGIDTIDYLVISHPHIDHLGGYQAVLRHKTVKQIYNNAGTYTTLYAYNAFLDEVAEKNIPIKTLYQGDEFSFGGVNVEVLWPATNYEHNNSNRVNQNNGSLALKLTYGKSSFLMSGDLHVESEAEVIAKYGSKLQADVHKMNHHGNDTSSSSEWIKTVNAKIAVSEVSTLRSDKILGRFLLNGSTVLTTGMNGTIAVWTSGDGEYDIQVELENYHDFTDVPDSAKNGHWVVK